MNKVFLCGEEMKLPVAAHGVPGEMPGYLWKLPSGRELLIHSTEHTTKGVVVLMDNDQLAFWRMKKMLFPAFDYTRDDTRVFICKRPPDEGRRVC